MRLCYDTAHQNTDMNNTPNNPDRGKISQATRAVIRQLSRSERGQQVLLDFRTLLDNGGWGLDYENWEALHSLCLIARSGKTDALREYLPRQND